MSDSSAANGPTDLPVSALVGDDVERIAPDATLIEVAVALNERGIGMLAVGDGARPAGVVSERDLVRALAEGRDPATTTAMDVAHTELRWVEPDTTVGEVAAEMMTNWVRHVLVRRDGVLVGVVSMRDLVGVYSSTDDLG